MQYTVYIPRVLSSKTWHFGSRWFSVHWVVVLVAELGISKSRQITTKWKGFVSIVILGAWFLWKHCNNCMFNRMTPGFRASGYAENLRHRFGWSQSAASSGKEESTDPFNGLDHTGCLRDYGTYFRLCGVFSLLI